MSSLRHWIFGTILSLCCLTVHGREECEPGKYGDGCSRNCSQGCKAFPNNEVLCHKETGTCFEGCNAGVYGDRCDQQCSRNCKEYTCIQQNGHCVLGCIENHIGDFCETYQQTTVVHQGTTSSSRTTVTTGVAPTTSSQVVMPVVVTVLVLILVGEGVIFIWRRKKEKKKRALDTNVEKRSSSGELDPDVVKRLLPDDSGEERSGIGDDESEEDDGSQRMNLAHIKTAPKIPRLAVFVTVVKRHEIEMRNGKEQFRAEVADETSAVDISVTNRNLFDKFRVNSGLILENVSWSGTVLFLNEKSKVTSTGQRGFNPSLVEEAFGEGEVVPIIEALSLKPKSWVALKGKIVKQSGLTKRYSFGKLLTHRQIKLADRSGSVYVDVWEDEAVNLESDDVIHMTGCKRKKYESVDESSVTTTRKTRVKKLKETEFDGINIDQGFASGILQDIEVEICKSYPEPGCYHFKLDDKNSCKSCLSTVRHPVC